MPVAKEFRISRILKRIIIVPEAKLGIVSIIKGCKILKMDFLDIEHSSTVKELLLQLHRRNHEFYTKVHFIV